MFVAFIQQLLNDALVELGQLDQTLDDVIGLLQQMESDVQLLDNIYGDPNFIEMHQTNLRVSARHLHILIVCKRI